MYEIELSSENPLRGELPPRYLGQILARIQPATQAAVSMAFRNRSRTFGKVPGWLRRAADIRLVGFSGNGTTRLQFHAPLLEEAAPKLYAQGELFATRPSGHDTALDLLADSILDVAAENENSERYDKPLLGKITAFRTAFNGPFQSLTVLGARRPSATISTSVIQVAARLKANTPAPRRVRIVGKLDSISDSRQTFELLLDDGNRVRGVLLTDSMGSLSQLFRKSVLMYGQAFFRPSGQLLRIDADGFRAAGESDHFFAAMPKPIGIRQSKYSVNEREKMAKGLKSIIGKWPGDESDEQVDLALRELG